MTGVAMAARMGVVQAPAFIAAAPPTQELFAAARRIAASSIKVLITGESGVGKDVLARFIHAESVRAAGPFVALNCAGLAETLLESELFGHVRGSFTGAHRDTVGKLRLANHGTVFLDEIGEMAPRMQALLLRFLENGEIQPVGSESAVTRSDVRVIAATNRDLDAMVADGRFREDLLYRIKVAHLHVPSLRERREDIAPLVEQALRRVGGAHSVTPEAMEALSRYPWPGNIRELQNVVEQVLSMTAGAAVQVADLPRSIQSRAAVAASASPERRRQVADDLYERLVAGECGFWQHLQAAFLSRDLTRRDVREVVRRGLRATGGSYRAMLPLFHVDPADYKRVLNFLAAHDCRIDVRDFRNGPPKITDASRAHQQRPH